VPSRRLLPGRRRVRRRVHSGRHQPDRHRAIVHPLRARLTRRQLIGAFVVIWAAALTMSLPVAALSRVDTQQTEDGTGTLDYCKEMCHL